LLQIEWHEFTLITNSLFAFKQCIMFNSCFSGSFFLMNFCFDLYPSKVWNACIPVISTTPWLSIHKKFLRHTFRLSHHQPFIPFTSHTNNDGRWCFATSRLPYANMLVR
jgi:hypothetical protein